LITNKADALLHKFRILFDFTRGFVEYTQQKSMPLENKHNIDQ